jgi:hypothetical protein
MSWKQYGGIRKNDKLSNLGVGTLVADDIILRQVKVTTHIFDDTIIAKKDIKVHRNLDVSNNVDVSGELVVHKNIHTPTYVFGTNKDISLNYEENDGYRAYISADVNNQYIGLGTNAPKSYFDISSTVVDSFAVRNNLPYIRNILTQNQNESGIIVDTSNDIANIGFFYRDVSNSESIPRVKITADMSNDTLILDNSINYITSQNETNITSKYATLITTVSGDISMNSESIYLTGLSGDIILKSSNATFITTLSGDIDISANEGDITITSFDTTKFRSSVAVSERDTTNKIKNEPFTIYDNSNGEPFIYKYYNDPSLNSGTSSVSVAIDNSSTTFSHLLTPDVKGLSIGGGAYVKDSSRSMGMIGLSTTDLSFIPSQSYVSNNNIVYRTTTGINTYAPRLNNYIMDINGPTRIGNGELHPVINHTSKLTDIRSSKDNLNYVFTAGRREELLTENVIPETFGYASIDSGRTWTKVTIENNDANRDNNIHIFAVDDKAYTITDNFRIHRYNFSTGAMDLSNQLINDLQSSSIFVKNFQNSDPVMLISGKSTNPPYTNKIYYATVDSNFHSLSNTSLDSIDNQASDTKASDGYGNTAYFVGNGIQVVDTTNQIPVLKKYLSVLAGGRTYNTVSAFNTNMAVAAGKNIINYTIDGGYSWTPIDEIIINGNKITEFDIKRLHMLPDGKGLAIGTYNNDTNGFIIYTQDLNNWKSIPEEIAFYSFGNEDVLRQPSINNVCISKDGSFVFTNVTKEVSGEIDDNSYDSGSSTIYYGLYPALFDVYNNKVLDVNGGMNVNGQILQF